MIKRNYAEAPIQIDIVKKLRSVDHFVHSIPNAAAGSNALRQAQEITLGLWPGVADLLDWSPIGWPTYIEVKSDTGKQSKDQRRFQSIIEALGVRYILARSVEDVEKELGL